MSVVGEVREAEALDMLQAMNTGHDGSICTAHANSPRDALARIETMDMLQAMNTGHDGSLTTTHANSPREALARLETLVLMSGLELPVRAIREQIAGAVHVLVQQSRLSDGSRRVTAITEVTGINDEGEIEIVPIFQFIRTGTGDKGKVIGEYRATGFLPTYLNQFLVMGLVKPGERFL